MPPCNSANSARTAQDEVVPNVEAEQAPSDGTSPSSNGSSASDPSTAFTNAFQQAL